MSTYVESNNGSDEDFEVGLEDFDTSDSDADLSLSDDDDDDEEDVEPRTAGDWVFITDPYNDASPPSFDFAPVYTDVHPAMELESLRSPLECFLAFVPEKRITYFCDCANKRACSYFTARRGRCCLWPEYRQVHSNTNTGAQKNNENKRRIYEAAAPVLQNPACARQSAQISRYNLQQKGSRDRKKEQAVLQVILGSVQEQAESLEVQIEDDFTKLHQFLDQEEGVLISKLRNEEEGLRKQLDENGSYVTAEVSRLEQAARDLENKLTLQETPELLKNEQTKKWRQELGLPDPEPTELELLLQKWEQACVAPQSPEPEGEELPLPEPRGEEPPEPRGEEPSLPEPRGEEPLFPEPRGEEGRSIPPPQPRPPPLQSSSALLRPVPQPLLLDTLPVFLDLPVLDLEPRSLQHWPQLCPWFPAPLSPSTQTTMKSYFSFK
ncbi:UNVERIFIED_CONTAM: hypothetical protein FKN15_077315 [Acipenser sinensis]